MKLTKSKLKQLIKEELTNVLEVDYDGEEGNFALNDIVDQLKEHRKKYPELYSYRSAQRNFSQAVEMLLDIASLHDER